MPSYTSDVLIARVKNYCSLPDSNPRFTDSTIIDMLNDDMINDIQPLISSIREEWFVEYFDYTISSDQHEYAIPTRAVGGGLRCVEYYDSSSGSDSNAYYPVTRVDPYARWRYSDGFYLRGNFVYLINPSANAGRTLRLTYERKPNFLVATTAVGLITAINTSTLEVTVSSAPTTFVATAVCDFIKGTPLFEWRGIDYTISSVASNVITFTSLPSDLAVGDYLCLAQESPIAQVPLEAQNLLCQGTAIKIMESLADAQGVSIGNNKYEQMKQGVMQAMSPRIQSNNKKVNNYGVLTRRQRYY